MSKEQNNQAGQPVADLPKGFPPELIPLYDWWKKEGRSWLVSLAIAGAAVAAFYGIKAWVHSRQAAASRALATASSADELETAVAQYGSSKAGGLMKLRLAQAYYNEGRFLDAHDLYSSLLDSEPEGFQDRAKIGLAFSLEGLKKYDEARNAFAQFAADEANAKSYLLFTAKLGAARCKAQAGDKEGAIKDLEDIKATCKKDSADEARVEALIDVCKRWEPRSLFDAANEAAKQIQPDAPAAAPAVESAPATPAAAPVAEKPVEQAPAAPAAAPAEAPAAEKPAEPANADK